MTPQTNPTLKAIDTAPVSLKTLDHWANSLLTTLTLDIATETGWALLKGGRILETGTLVLATDAEIQKQETSGGDRTGDIRFTRLLLFVEQQVRDGVERIVFEDVQFTRSIAQAQLWPSLRAAVWAACRASHVNVQCVPATTLKVFAGGNISADKAFMAEALAQTDASTYAWNVDKKLVTSDGKELDHNQVDAIWLARYATAVDAGRQQFLYTAQRKAAAKAEKRSKRAAQVAAAKASGRCCGLLRRPGPFGRAVCRKCGKTVKLPHAAHGK